MKSRSLFLAVGITLAAACATLTAPAHAGASFTETVHRTVVGPVSPDQPETARRATATYATAARRTVNRQRARHDRRRLRAESCLLAQAQARAAAMARSGRLAHAALGPIQAACGLRSLGENIAAGYPSGRSVVNRGWMHSAGHRANILSTRYRRLAVGAAQDRRGVWYVSMLAGRR